MIQRDIQLPLTSQINGYMEHYKKELNKLSHLKNKIQNEIKSAKEEKKALAENFQKLKNKNLSSLSFLSWYNRLREELLNNEIYIENEIKSFSNMIYDAKSYEYNVFDMIGDYKQIDSLSSEIFSLQSAIDLKLFEKNSLDKEAENLRKEIEQSTEFISQYDVLSHLGFGYKELKYLGNLITEICKANGTSSEDAIKKFLNDVKRQYNNKLGLDKRVNEIKAEMKKLEKQIPEYLSNLQMQGAVSVAINQLSAY